MAAIRTGSTTDQPPRARRWIPLSLKIFGAFLAILCAVGLVWMGARHYQIRAAIDAIESSGGRAELRAGGPGWLRRWTGDGQMLAFDEIRLIDLGGTETT